MVSTLRAYSTKPTAPIALSKSRLQFAPRMHFCLRSGRTQQSQRRLSHSQKSRLQFAPRMHFCLHPERTQRSQRRLSHSQSHVCSKNVFLSTPLPYSSGQRTLCHNSQCAMEGIVHHLPCCVKVMDSPFLKHVHSVVPSPRRRISPI